MELEPFQKRTWAEIDLDAAKKNFNIIKLHTHSKICCVVKANAYGHGAVPLAKLYEKEGADYFAVSNIEEALQLRRNNITKPILILGYTDPRCASLLAANEISQCVFSEEYGRSLSAQAVTQSVNVRIHIKLDTGMGRIGFLCRNEQNLAVEEIERVCGLRNLIPEGIFTHFASADEGSGGETFTKHQFKCFNQTISLLEEKGIKFQLRHCANSAAIFDYPEMHLDMVRAGVVLYGLQPSEELRHPEALSQVMTLHTIVDHIKEVNPGDCISYGRTYTADKKQRIATIPVGYADGLWRANSVHHFKVEVEHEMAPVVGRICMDQCMIDVTDIPEAHIGSEVMVYGTRKENSVDAVATANQTINYEIVCALGERVPRVYVSNGEVVDIADSIL